MRRTAQRMAATAVFMAGALWAAADARAEDNSVVARVGGTEITVSDVEFRLGKLAPLQLQRLGATPEEARKNFVDQVMVKEALVVEAARRAKLAERPETRARILRILRSRLIKEIADELEAKNEVSDADIGAYYKQHPDKYVTPTRLAIWRILVEKKREAEKLIQTLKNDLTVNTWNALAAEKSLDKATNLRGGNLGFVGPDGKSSSAGVEVDPELYKAASRVEDVELVPEPVPERGRWAVVWRRKAMSPVTRTLEDEKENIRQVLFQSAVEKRVVDLITTLRKDRVTDVSLELVDELEITSTAEVQRAARPGVLPKGDKTKARPAPAKGPGGLR